MARAAAGVAGHLGATQTVAETFAQFGQLRRDDCHAIGVTLSFAIPIGLVIILCRIPFRRAFDSRDDRRGPVGRGACNSVARRVGLRGVEREDRAAVLRSEEHTSELQSLMRISYAVFCLKKKITRQ